MSVTITRGATVLAPALVLDGYEQTRSSGNQVHEVIGSALPDVTFGTASSRAGTLRLFFLTEAAARSCEAALTLPGSLVLADSALPSAGLRFVPVDRLGVRADPATGRWIVTVPYREVGP